MKFKFERLNQLGSRKADWKGRKKWILFGSVLVCLTLAFCLLILPSGYFKPATESIPPGGSVSYEAMASKVLHPEGRALTFQAKAAWSAARTDAAKHFGGVVRDSTVTRSC